MIHRSHWREGSGHMEGGWEGETGGGSEPATTSRGVRGELISCPKGNKATVLVLVCA